MMMIMTTVMMMMMVVIRHEDDDDDGGCSDLFRMINFSEKLQQELIEYKEVVFDLWVAKMNNSFIVNLI